MAKVSVIIPVYNTEKYIEKCLDSITKQTMKDIEIIIINDGSTDNSEQVILEYIKNHPESNLLYFKKDNGGLSDARNYGVSYATGKYISFIDSDDYIENNLYENLEEFMDKDIDLIKFKMQTVTEDGKIIEKIDGPIFEICSGQQAFEKLYTTDTFLEVSCIYLYRREFFIQNKFEFELNAYHEDFGLIPWIIINAETVVSTNNFGYFYLKRENSITDEKQLEKEKKKAYDILKHYDNAIKRIENINLKTENKIMFKRYYTNVLLIKVNNLIGKEQDEFIKKIKLRNVYKNITPKNFKQLIKRILIRLNIKLYLKLR